ncbi:MAG: T9SS type A sorting domain-containing protein [Flavobacteriales bacterium]|nr:T9SS type A sorting domain-containing protein [Flavobacteriales bacterium]
MKKVLLSLQLLLITLLTGAQIIVSGEIASNTTWTNDNIYLLDGWVYVRNGATLTIEPGTIIKGDFTTKGSLIIERGAMIMAEGTAEQPIVFTSQKPAGQRSYGDWGGLILCGRASVNTPENAGNGTAAGEAIIEGGVGSIYGGGATPDDNDNSGTLRYVRIEFGGIPFQPNSEINGLTCGGVGRGTTIDHVQVSYSGDDGFEWFGGTVNCTNLISYNNWDDDFDTDFGFRGNIQFGLIVRDPNIADQSGSNGFESDNDGQGTTNTPITQPVFSNITVVGPLAFSSTINSNYKRALHLRRNTKTSVFNSVFVGYPTGLLIDGSTTHANAQNNDLRFMNSVLCFMNDTLATSSNANPNNVSGTFNIDSWFNTSGYGNSNITNVSELMFAQVDNAQPNFTLTAGSPLLSGASFTDSYLNNSFFETTTYRGAFGTENWTSCWAEFNPQNADYTSLINYAFTSSIELIGNATVCEGESVVMNAVTTAVNPVYTWSTGEESNSISVAAPASVTLEVTSGRGCTSASSVAEVSTYPTPSVNISADGPTSFCTGGSVVLSSSETSGNVWSNDATSASITVTASGVYSLNYTDENGCEATSNTIEVSVSDSPVPTITTNSDISICEGESVTLTASTSDSYVWNLNGNELMNETSQTIEATEEGAYTVTVTNADQCDGVGTSNFVFIQVNPTPTANFTFDFDFGSGTYDFSNNSTNATSYSWNFGDGNTSSEVNPIHTYNASGDYEVVLTATNGDCDDVYTFTLMNVGLTEVGSSEQFMVYPNPTNGDATLSISSINHTSAQYQVFDMTGKQVWMSGILDISGERIFTIPASTFGSGIYIVKVVVGDKTETIQLAVKN